MTSFCATKVLSCLSLRASVVAGRMPPIVTEPMVIRCKVNSTVKIQLIAQDANSDPITYSLLFPRPSLASLRGGETHMNKLDPWYQKLPLLLLLMMLLLIFVSVTIIWLQSVAV